MQSQDSVQFHDCGIRDKNSLEKAILRDFGGNLMFETDITYPITTLKRFGRFLYITGPGPDISK